ncbi:TPA: lytic transglycosylase [Serratia fonticola]|nr:lytic transglycosylase [Serratia fonticola]
MQSKIFYCKFWFRIKKIALEHWSEEMAYAKHLADEPYTVLVDSESQPSSFIEVIKNKEMIGVGFLDKFQREYLIYQFKIIKNDAVFLTMAVHRDFIGETDIISNGTSYIFKEDGHTFITEEDFINKTINKYEVHTDISTNYDKIPEFGCYESLIKIER